MPTPTPQPREEWANEEGAFLTEHLQLTSREQFLKAGEQYFSPDDQWIIFQGIPAPKPGEQPGLFYGMYVGKLIWSGEGADRRITGMEPPFEISPPGSANTCGWFHPTECGLVMYASTLVPPTAPTKPGFQVGGNRYVWSFPEEMELVRQWLPAIAAVDPASDGAPQTGPASAEIIFSKPDYDAECSWSRDGRYVLYANVTRPEGKPDADIYVYDTQSKTHTPLVVAKGYDGGPFFSPDERWIAYRSDRHGDDLLQLYAAELKRDESGAIIGIEREQQITQNKHVNWAPYWHPSGQYLVYGTSQMGHANYEIFAVEFVPGRPTSAIRQKRITWAKGADVLPTFSSDGSYLMWTGQRGPMAEGESKPSSQIWVARVDPLATVGAMFRTLDEQGAIEAGQAYFMAEEGKGVIPKWIGAMEWTAERTDDGWLVTQWQVPKSATGFRRVILEPNGRAIRYVRPRE
jgi:TolB protein